MRPRPSSVLLSGLKHHGEIPLSPVQRARFFQTHTRGRRQSRAFASTPPPPTATLRPCISNSGSYSYSNSNSTHPTNKKQPQTQTMSTAATTKPPKLLYASRTLRSQSNTPNGEVSPATIFHYQQTAADPHIVSATYAGGSIVRGHLIGTLSADGGNVLTMCYHHVNDQGRLMTGRCVSTPEVLADGRLRLWERWVWTSGGEGEGESVVEEVEEVGEEVDEKEEGVGGVR